MSLDTVLTVLIKMLLKSLLLLLIVPCDLIRGGQFHFNSWAYPVLRKIGQFAYGFIIGFYLSDDWRFWVASSILWWVGEKQSWRQVIDEVSGLKPQGSRLPLRLAWVGLRWAMPISILSLFGDKQFLLPYVMGISFPLAAYAAYRWLGFKNKHFVMEAVRPLIFGGLLCAGLNTLF
jgi:hypothetical protein